MDFDSILQGLNQAGEYKAGTKCTAHDQAWILLRKVHGQLYLAVLAGSPYPGDVKLIKVDPRTVVRG